MFGGQGRVPLVARLPIGIWTASAAQHSQSFEAWFAHVPGLVVVAPSTPQDNYGLLHAALASGDPVVYMEHKELWGMQGEVQQGERIELGRARTAFAGSANGKLDVTIVSWSKQVRPHVDAAKELQAQGIHAEVIDLRTSGRGTRMRCWRAPTAQAACSSCMKRCRPQARRRNCRDRGRAHGCSRCPSGRASHSRGLREHAGNRIPRGQRADRAGRRAFAQPLTADSSLDDSASPLFALESFDS